MAVHHKVGVKNNNLVSRVDHTAQCQEQSTGCSSRDQHLAVGMPKLGIDGPLKRGPQLGNALSDRVGVMSSVYGLNCSGLDVFGNVKVREPDREIDRVFHRFGHVERLADSRGVDVLHPVGDPGVVHG